MRRLLALLAVTLLAASCSSDDGPDATTTPPPDSVAPEADLPVPVQQFLDEVAEPGDVAFRATYDVLQKLGGAENRVEVLADPPAWQVRVGDLTVVEGERPATCRPSAERCVGEVREELLAPVGVFSRFFATAPAQSLATDARRAVAGELVTSERTVAGVVLRCAGIPLSGVVSSTYCLTPEGVFGWVDTPAVHYELTDYAPGPPGEPLDIPYEVSPGEL